jgi:hypothetical protein
MIVMKVVKGGWSNLADKSGRVFLRKVKAKKWLFCQ